MCEPRLRRTQKKAVHQPLRDVYFRVLFQRIVSGDAGLVRPQTPLPFPACRSGPGRRDGRTEQSRTDFPYGRHAHRLVGPGLLARGISLLPR